MVFLLCFLTILSYGFASYLREGIETDLLDIYEPKYFPNIPNEDTENDYINVPNDDVNDKGSFNLKKYLLSILHNEKINKDVLDNLLEAKILRKRSAIKLLKSMTIGNTFDSNKTSSTYPQSHNFDFNYDLAAIVVNLTNAVTKLNENLGRFQQQVNDDAYIMVKVPITNKQSEGNATRYERDIETESLLNESSYDQNTVVVKSFEESLAKHVASSNPNGTSIESKTGTNTDNNNKSEEANSTKSKREVTTVETSTTDEIKQDKSNEDTTANVFDTNSTTVLEEFPSKISLKTDLIENVTEDIITTSEGKYPRETENETIDINPNHSIELRANKTNVNTNNIQKNSPDINASIVRNVLSENRTFVDVTRSFNKKNRMLINIDSTLADIKKQISPVNAVKQIYTSQALYKIGYIVASLDTLETTLRKIKLKLSLNKDNWMYTRLLRIYNKLQLTKQLVDNIVNHLKTYTEQNMNTNNF